MSHPNPLLHRLGHFDAHHRLFISLGVAAITFAVLPWRWAVEVRALATWNAYVFTVLVLAWITITTADPEEVMKGAKLQDSGRNTIFIFVVGAACVSIFAVGLMLNAAKGLHGVRLTERVVFSLFTVVSSWVLVHTVFALRYAHIYYGTDEDQNRVGGLEFPDEESPDYLDFAYFSFIIGMTSQVSDVSIHSTHLRRLGLLHGLISFFFNVTIIALSINTVSGLL